jgi:hypothetical protein
MYPITPKEKKGMVSSLAYNRLPRNAPQMNLAKEGEENFIQSRCCHADAYIRAKMHLQTDNLCYRAPRARKLRTTYPY